MAGLHPPDVIPLYCGFDEREEAGYHVFASSVIERASCPVALLPLHLPLFRSFYGMGHRDGSNAFIYTRFLIPFLQGYRGWAVFADGADMLCLADIAELWNYRQDKAVMVVRHDYKTRHPRKYVGTLMAAANDDYPRKNWSSVMLMNCAHPAWRNITPEAVATMRGPELHRLAFIPDVDIGELPPEWNWLCQERDEQHPNAKIVHFTVGVPAFEHYHDSPHADDWRRQLAERVNHVTA